MYFSRALGALTFASSVFAQSQQYCPADGVCYAVNVPEATSSSGSGDIYFQISGPTSMSWIGLGQGTQMKGANIFVMYADASGTNVTLSPRLGTGHVMPTTDGSTSTVTLLEGSGISDGTMTANVRCSNCLTWSGGSMSTTDTSSDWIYAYNEGAPISSDSTDATIKFHTTYGEMTFNLQAATGGDSSDPFVAAATSAGSGSSSGSSSSSSGTSSYTSSTESGSSGSSSGGSGTVTKTPSNYNTVVMAHAVIGGLVFVIFMPLGGMAMRLLSFPGLVWLHAGWMIFAYTLAIVVLGMGIWMANTIDKLDEYHPIIGIIVIIGLVFQPFTGWTHHNLFKRRGQRTTVSWGHILWGRFLITLGIINGGLGLLLAYNSPVGTKNGSIAYGVIAGIVWVTWMAVIALTYGKGKRQQDYRGDSASAERFRKSESGGRSVRT